MQLSLSLQNGLAAPVAFIAALGLAVLSPPGDSHDGMAPLTGGTFRMGSNSGTPDQVPEHEVKLKSFWLDRQDVTVAQFSKFVSETGYVTDAERRGRAIVFENESTVPLIVVGANWHRPEGPNQPEPPLDEPVCQVSWNDASAYAKWAGKRLPTEAEWEYAARGGPSGQTYPWGDTLTVGGKYMANTMGSEDGYSRRSPVGVFPPNNFGLYDMSGNVWQWCSDYYQKDYYKFSPSNNPQGPRPNMVGHVTRGGSWYCGGTRCQGHRVATRSCDRTDAATNNMGFRCAANE